MKPTVVFSGTNTDYEIDLAARENHENFTGCWDPSGCGRIYFYGTNATAEAEMLMTEGESKSFSDWGEYIQEQKKNNIFFNAISLTLFSNRVDEHGKKVIFKRTYYVNNKKSCVTVFESDFLGEGNNGRIFSKTETRTLPFNTISHIFKRVFEALNIF